MTATCCVARTIRAASFSRTTETSAVSQSRKAKPFVGIVRVRPGHISSAFVPETLQASAVDDVDAQPPFFVVIERRADVVRGRMRVGREK
jgi:hypothetical protein